MVFAVALLAAVVAVTLPAVERAGVQRGDAQVESAVESLLEEARTLAAGNDAVPDAPARRTVALDLPTDGFAAAGLRSLSVVGPGGSDGARNATRFVWRVAGGARHTRLADGVRLRPASGRIDVESGGSLRLRLKLVARDGERVVTVAPLA